MGFTIKWTFLHGFVAKTFFIEREIGIGFEIFWKVTFVATVSDQHEYFPSKLNAHDKFNEFFTFSICLKED